MLAVLCLLFKVCGGESLSACALGLLPLSHRDTELLLGATFVGVLLVQASRVTSSVGRSEAEVSLAELCEP